MEIYSKEEFIRDLENYIKSLNEWNDDDNKMEQVTNSTLEGFLQFLTNKDKEEN